MVNGGGGQKGKVGKGDKKKKEGVRPVGALQREHRGLKSMCC